MTQQINRPPKKAQEHDEASAFSEQSPISRRGMLALLTIVGLVFLVFTGLFVRKSPDLVHPPVDAPMLTATAVQMMASPLQLPGAARPAQLQLSGSHTVVYAQKNALYRVSTPDSAPQPIQAPGYSYNRAVPPVLLANNQLLYSGNGLWITSIFPDGQPARQIASIPADQVVTSLVLAANGHDIAWSTAPANGNGVIRIYAGPLNSSSLVYQSAANKCPCFRVFSLTTTQKTGQMRLLLSNDYGDHQAVTYNLWVLTVAPGTNSAPRPLLANNPPQMPLAQTGDTLLYSTSNGFVPLPTDNSAPDDVAALNYANGLSLSTLNDAGTALQTKQTILPAQRDPSSFASDHWIATPRFSPDGQTLIYVQFSSDGQVPFARHSALYTVRMHDKGADRQAGEPQLLATTSARFVELGPWLNNSVLTFYADNALYAVDIRTGTTMLLTRLNDYGYIVAIIGS